MFSKPNVLVVALAALLGLAASPLLATTYKWVDDKGVVHYGDKIPPEYAGKANTELGKSGITLKKNEGQLTPEQLKARAIEQHKEQEEQQRSLEVQRKNKALLTTYSNVQEIDIAREKNLQQADETIRGIQQKIVDTQTKQLQLQKEANSYKGKKMPTDLKKSMDDADKDLRDNQLLVVSKRKELDSIRAKFDDEKRTYIELTGGADNGATPESKSK
jgi:Domain of unknown function (DUF4124)